MNINYDNRPPSFPNYATGEVDGSFIILTTATL